MTIKGNLISQSKSSSTFVITEYCCLMRNEITFSCQKRHVLLKLYYLGWDYQGFATQENSGNTIEHHLFSALQKTCLIQSRETSNYHRCGRTDKGVSAFSQVVLVAYQNSFKVKVVIENKPFSGDFH